MTIANLLAPLPVAGPDEIFDTLIERPGVRLERIVSHGQATPADAPMVQDRDEWVMLLAGAAALRIGDATEVALMPGDHVTIPAGVPHRVTRTSADPPAVWLALHLGRQSGRKPLQGSGPCRSRWS